MAGRVSSANILKANVKSIKSIWYNSFTEVTGGEPTDEESKTYTRYMDLIDAAAEQGKAGTIKKLHQLIKIETETIEILREQGL